MEVEIALAVAEAVFGAVEVSKGLVESSKGGFELKADGASYPKELQGYVKEGKLINRDVLTFVANGYIWDTNLGIGMRGGFSDTNDELMCFEDAAGIPSNRFLTDVGFYPSVDSDSVSSTLLRVNITAQTQLGGGPENPRLRFFVDGQFDPVGFGDERFSFYLEVDTYGNVTTSKAKCSDGLRLTDAGDHIELYVNQ
jgi:hypothetical protein